MKGNRERRYAPELRPAQPAAPLAHGRPGADGYLRGAREVGLSQLEPDLGQPRRTMDPIRLGELARSIVAYGLLQPLLVHELGMDLEGPQSGNLRYRIIAGGRRYAALLLACEQAAEPGLLARLQRVPVVVSETPEATIRVVQLVENLQRDELNPIEEARAYVELLDLQRLTVADLAQRLHRSDQYLYDRIRLLADQAIADAVQEGRLSLTVARDLQKLPPAAQEEAKLMLSRGQSISGRGVDAFRVYFTAQDTAPSAAPDPSTIPPYARGSQANTPRPTSIAGEESPSDQTAPAPSAVSPVSHPDPTQANEPAVSSTVASTEVRCTSSGTKDPTSLDPSSHSNESAAAIAGGGTSASPTIGAVPTLDSNATTAPSDSPSIPSSAAPNPARGAPPSLAAMQIGMRAQLDTFSDRFVDLGPEAVDLIVEYQRFCASHRLRWRECIESLHAASARRAKDPRPPARP